MGNENTTGLDGESTAVDLEQLETTLKSKETDLARRERNVTEEEQKINHLENEVAQKHRAVSERLEKLAAQLTSDRQAIELTKSGLTQREQAVIIAEQERDAGFADKHAALNANFRDKRSKMEVEISDVREKKLSALEDEFAALKKKRFDDVARSEQIERDRIRAEITHEREVWTKQKEDNRKQLEMERTEFEKQMGALSALQCEVEGRKMELETAERTHERTQQRLERKWQTRNEKLDDEVDAKLDEARKSFESQKKSFIEENSRLRESLAVQTQLLGAFEQLKRQLGGIEPAEVLRNLNSQTDELKRLREELATRPTEEMRERYQILETEVKHQKARADKREAQVAANDSAMAEVADLRRKNSELTSENSSLEQRASRYEGAAKKAEEELQRHVAAYKNPVEKAERHKQLEKPRFEENEVKQPVKFTDEKEWLTGIGNNCKTYGLEFNPRILKAFHTALKTAEWSPLTILAGVSGTGKSELPRLYSHFGGIYFEPLSVQPNWDSKESMLGFFNSIDNKFDAQPILRFLAQSQKKRSEDYPGLFDAVCLVLLDEMNLAHPELYFAEFLSKLELRRGAKGDNLPTLDVKIGSDMGDYELPLGRNVLWTGTMNQDETTKSLSDKVVDRSIIINFPRPTQLRSRKELKSLNDIPFTPLHRASWESWWVKKVDFKQEEITPYRKFTEEINVALGAEGRAIGYRVWQSIEYYMANYPDVLAAQKADDKDALKTAMHTAFEDQLVQKIMPKLRGIDTRGDSRDKCLNKILDRINQGIDRKPFNLAVDFDLSIRLGHGQFIWQTANYLKDDSANESA